MGIKTEFSPGGTKCNVSAKFGGDFVLFCVGTVGCCSGPASHGISQILLTGRLCCLPYTWFLTCGWFYTRNLEKYDLFKWIVISVSGSFHSTGSLMSIVIASSWVQCAICSAQLSLVQRWHCPARSCRGVAGTQRLHPFLCYIEERFCFRSCEITQAKWRYR